MSEQILFCIIAIKLLKFEEKGNTMNTMKIKFTLIYCCFYTKMQKKCNVEWFLLFNKINIKTTHVSNKFISVVYQKIEKIDFHEHENSYRKVM